MNPLRVAGAAALLGALAVGCSGDKEPAKGQLMVVVQTDMALPKDVDSVRVEVSSYGSVQFSNDYQVGQGFLLMPATLGLVAGSDPSRPVTVRVIALQQGKARVLREATTTVPTDRLAMLRMPLQWLCDGQVSQSVQGLSTQYSSACPEGQTCAAGECIKNLVPPESLPSYEPGRVFGGGMGVGDGACFDTEACFRGQPLAEVDPVSCTVARPAGGSINVALVTAQGSGICEGGRCYIPLDQGAEGFREENGKVVLPAGVCKRLANKTLQGAVVSTTCASKTDTLPPCGPWSSAGKPPAPQETPVQKACLSWCGELCSYSEKCDIQTLASLGGAKSCVGRCGSLCDYFLGFPGLEINEASFLESRDTLKSLHCSSLDNVIAFPSSPFQGTLKNGETCVSYEQCAGGTCSHGGLSVCGVCASGQTTNIPPYSRKLGEPCVDTENCASGMLCGTNGTCIKGQTKGATCSAQAPCDRGYSCVSGTGKATCKSHDAQLDQACQHASDTSPIKSATDCDASKGLVCFQGKCKKLPPVGQPCPDDVYVGDNTWTKYSGECLDGYCFSPLDGSPTCKAFLADGAPCSSADHCLTPASCIKGACTIQNQKNLCGSGGAAGSGGSGGAGGAGGSGGAGAAGSAGKGGASGIVCGNGKVEGTEECDDGNFSNSDACTDACKKAKCGDTFVQAGEECDDGNKIDNDACSNSCKFTLK